MPYVLTYDYYDGLKFYVPTAKALEEGRAKKGTPVHEFKLNIPSTAGADDYDLELCLKLLNELRLKLLNPESRRDRAEKGTPVHEFKLNIPSTAGANDSDLELRLKLLNELRLELLNELRLELLNPESRRDRVVLCIIGDDLMKMLTSTTGGNLRVTSKPEKEGIGPSKDRLIIYDGPAPTKFQGRYMLMAKFIDSSDGAADDVPHPCTPEELASYISALFDGGTAPQPEDVRKIRTHHKKLEFV